MFFAAIVSHNVTKLEWFETCLAWHSGGLKKTGLVAEDLAFSNLDHSIFVWDENVHIGKVDESNSTIDFYISNSLEEDHSVNETTSPQFSLNIESTEVAMSISAISDYVASIPVYFGQESDYLIFSNDPLFIGIVLKQTELNESGAFELMTYSHTLASQSTIEGVMQLRPNETITASVSKENGVLTNRNNKIEPAPELISDTEVISHQMITYESLLEGIRENKFLNENIESAVIGLSGGWDSRLTLGALVEVFGPEKCQAITADLADQKELDAAIEVANALGVRHRIIAIQKAKEADILSGWQLTGGQVSVHAAAVNIVIYRNAGFPDQSKQILVGAWTGGTLIGSFISPDSYYLSKNKTRRALRKRATERGRDWNKILKRSPILSGDVRALQKESKNKLIKSMIHGTLGDTAAEKISYWAMFYRQPNFAFISPSRLTSNIIEVAPVIYKPYLENLLRLRSIDIFNKNFYQGMIARTLPVLKKIPNGKTQQPPMKDYLGPNPMRKLFRILDAFPRPIQNLIRSVAGKPKLSRVVKHSRENEQWLKLFESLEYEPVFVAGNFKVDLTRTKDVHILGLGIALSLTKQYLQKARDELQG